MKKWFIPLLALWLYGCSAGPGEEDIRQQVTAKLLAETDANLFEISDFTILGKEERMEGVYLVKVSYQLHFKQGLDQLQVLHDEDSGLRPGRPLPAGDGADGARAQIWRVRGGPGAATRGRGVDDEGRTGVAAGGTGPIKGFSSLLSATAGLPLPTSSNLGIDPIPFSLGRFVRQLAGQP